MGCFLFLPSPTGALKTETNLRVTIGLKALRKPFAKSE